ncbi:MAG: hypothetical protein LRY73_18760 [Bacillus sp. (in: Bacteria)]|nr:hypothetical protein [Bacillus sp. (in: firmicutes)]
MTILDKELLKELEDYIQLNRQPLILENLSTKYIQQDLYELSPSEIENFIEQKRQPTLKEVLFQFIDEKGCTDAEVYRKAGIDRKHFSKIRSKDEYKPKKSTIVALALALELSKKQTVKLLDSAGYSLSDSDTLDLVISFFLEKQNYNIHEVNEALDYFSLKPLC